MDNAGFTSADVIGLAVVVIGIILGLKQGLSRQMALLLSGFSVAAALTQGFAPTHHWVVTHFTTTPDLARITTFLILVVIPIMIIMLLYAILRYLLKITFTTWVNRLGGAIAGGFTAAGIVLLCFMIFNYLPPEKCPAAVGQQSWISREVIGVETQLITQLTSRVETGESIIKKARTERAGKREKWEE